MNKHIKLQCLWFPLIAFCAVGVILTTVGAVLIDNSESPDDGESVNDKSVNGTESSGDNENNQLSTARVLVITGCVIILQSVIMCSAVCAVTAIKKQIEMNRAGQMV